MPTTPRRRSTATVAVLLLATLTTASCASASSSGEQSFTNWYSRGGQAHITALTGDVHAMGNAADLAADVQTCTSGVEHAAAAKAYPAIPDLAAQQHWVRMLDSFGKAARDCKTGAEKPDADLLRTSASELEQTLADSTALQERLRELGATAG